jgi:hypothetical protein
MVSACSSTVRVGGVQQAPSTRIVLGAVLVLVGLAVAERSLASERLECARARGTCVLERSGPVLGEAPRVISLADVAKVELREVDARGGPRGEVVFMSPRGADTRIFADKLAPARAWQEQLARFFAGEGERVEVAREPAPWVALACAALALFGLQQIVSGTLALRREGRDSGGPAAPRAASALPPWLRKVAPLALAFALLAIGLLTYASYTQGVLVLTCEQRCEFEGGVCMPGETRELSTTPGTYPIRVWDPSAPDGWRIREVTLVARETTRFRCALP